MAFIVSIDTLSTPKTKEFKMITWIIFGQMHAEQTTLLSYFSKPELGPCDLIIVSRKLNKTNKNFQVKVKFKTKTSDNSCTRTMFLYRHQHSIQVSVRYNTVCYC